MKPEEAIELLRSMQNPKQDYANLVCAPAFCTGYRYVYPEPEDYAIEEAISALKEVQQYRKIGTVEECRKAAEKQKPKQAEHSKWIGINGALYDLCPTCGTNLCTDSFLGEQKENYCGNCGQKLDWSEEE